MIPDCLPAQAFMARSFMQRLLGVWHPKARGLPVFLENCAWVHGFGLREPLIVWFFDRDGKPCGSRLLQPWGWAYCPGAHSCLEIRL